MKKGRNSDYLITVFLVLFIFSACKAQSNLSGKNKIFHYMEVDKIPTFGSKRNDLKNYLNEKLKWPSLDFEGEGSVIVYFIVNEEGVITNPKVIKKLCDYCDKEALRVLQIMPKWIPGVLNDKPVNVEVYLPIVFKLN